MGPIKGRIADGLTVGGAVLLAVFRCSVPASAQSPQAAPGMTRSADVAHSTGEVNCLTAALYYEARGEGVVGEQAVAQVVLNRLAGPGFPKSVCAVIYQGAPLPGCQFTFACDGSTTRPVDTVAWHQATVVAAQALAGFVDPAVAGATHYHTIRVHPLWDAAMQPTLTLGRHRFYRVTQGVPVGAGALGRVTLAAPAAVQGQLPRAASFNVWGLQVALVTPGRGGVDVSFALSPQPAYTVAPGTGS